MEVTAKVGKDGPIHKVNFDFGADLDAMVTKFGASVVHDKAKANMIVGLQSVMRTGIDDGKKGKELQTIADKWVPGIRKAAKPKTQKLKEDYQALSEEQRAELLAMIDEL